MTPTLSKYDNGRTATPILDRIRARCIVDEDGCWIWQGATVKGYGRLVVGSRRDGTRRKVMTHRATYEAKHGPVPDGMTLDHIVCDEPLCANPDHVAPATLTANILRSSGPTAVNARKTHCPKCGGPYTVKRNGHRDCRPCRLAYFREYNAGRNGQR